MNKNTKQRLAAYRKRCKQSGFPQVVFKAKRQPFPRIGKPKRYQS